MSNLLNELEDDGGRTEIPQQSNPDTPFNSSLSEKLRSLQQDNIENVVKVNHHPKAVRIIPKNITNTSAVKSSTQRKPDKEISVSTGDITCPHSGFRIKNLRISNEELMDTSKGGEYFPLKSIGSLSNFANKFTVGVMTSCSRVLKSKIGGQYLIWNLSDLNGHDLTIFLFQDAYEKHWKETVGTVLLIRNAKIFEADPSSRKSSDSDSSVPKVKVENSRQLLILGRSRDFARCKHYKQVLYDQALNRQAPTFSDSDIEDTDWNDLNDLESMARQTAGLNESESVKTLSKDQNAMESDTNESSFQRDMISNSTPPESNPNFQQAQPENQLDGEVADAVHGQLDEYQEESEMVELIQDDDCIIMDDSFSTCTPANSDDKVKETHHIQDTLEDKDEDVIILQAEGDFTDDLPHLRESCPRHPFNTKQAMHACKNCFCMVCDINWSECKKWSTHCKAKFGDPKWIAERNKAKCGFDDKTIKKHLKDIFDSIEDFSKATKRSIRQELEKRLGAEEGRLECRKNEISEWIMEHLDRL
ncbi:hypothetical protein GUITHDRAFT_113426 [Guillardia theta CCMP2712]|uniref:DEK-C domain-containing protein n=1 Tax=Guillardia theta (strain CCMP2712) TaxID=905079 RepID=L1IVW9_GUITC|nr:hypothetical protein GUITHDRAFT_113426 [Guillardia theta CCMP2712]EKX40398.1 hypothetical protein GUITHDRAFT_113426 [Guillardia theta CCMP2712]|eukprot:XP_005827378.1 hypothetical protein GUITHDRAFT_113426 [Guillardia theta CCMP2712]